MEISLKDLKELIGGEAPLGEYIEHRHNTFKCARTARRYY